MTLNERFPGISSGMKVCLLGLEAMGCTFLILDKEGKEYVNFAEDSTTKSTLVHLFSNSPSEQELELKQRFAEYETQAASAKQVKAYQKPVSRQRSRIGYGGLVEKFDYPDITTHMLTGETKTYHCDGPVEAKRLQQAICSLAYLKYKGRKFMTRTCYPNGGTTLVVTRAI